MRSSSGGRLIAGCFFLLFALCAAPEPAAAPQTPSARDPLCGLRSGEACAARGRALKLRANYIVKFGTYLLAKAHERVLRGLLQEVDGGWSITDRNNAASKYPTDFLLLEVFGQERKAEILDLLDASSSIEYVVKDSIIRKTLQSTSKSRGNHGERHARGTGHSLAEEYGFELPQRFKAKGAFIEEDLEEGSSSGRKLLKSSPVKGSVPKDFNADQLWAKGFSGKGVRIAVFDTNINKGHPHFKNVEERTNWTDERKLDDTLGHGSFVSGVMASQSKNCPGFAQDAELFLFRVFTTKQQSYTSWFLDAFNYAINRKVHLLNLSIGGPDYLDHPFVDKVREMAANNIIVVSAIGNDGPQWGTLNNPADMLEVIGVGGVNNQLQMAGFSSRGMTTHELPRGYGRIKPDVVAFGQNIVGSDRTDKCKTLSGTSVASPVVAGAVALLISTVSPKDEDERRRLVNPASIKQALVQTATKAPDPGMFEQGHGLLNVLGAAEFLKNYMPQASIQPKELDLTPKNCPYAWPYCTQPLYYSGMPIIVNMTLLNSMSVAGTVVGEPKWVAEKAADQSGLTVDFEYPDLVWPWVGYLAVFFSVNKDLRGATKTIKGTITLTVRSDKGELSEASATITVAVIPTPPREKRVLWDAFRSLPYPVGYFPRDNLDVRSDMLDWNADHPHTNFISLYDALKKKGLFLEVLGTDFSCVDASNYGAYLIVDSEEDFFEEEVEKIYKDVTEKGLSIVVVSEWYDPAEIEKVRFFDDNTKSHWDAVTGGGNVPALNSMLAPFKLRLGDRAYKGTVKSKAASYTFGSGNVIVQAPEGSFLLEGQLSPVNMKKTSRRGRAALSLGAKDSAEEEAGEEEEGSSRSLLAGNQVAYASATEFEGGKTKGSRNGWVVIYGDASCSDTNHRQGSDCSPWIAEMVFMAAQGQRDADVFPDSSRSAKGLEFNQPPLKLPRQTLFDLYSQVTGDESRKRGPMCSTEAQKQKRKKEWDELLEKRKEDAQNSLAAAAKAL